MKEVTIRRVNELREISQEIALFKNREKFIKVEFESFTDEENQSIEGEVQKLYFTCGCSLGRVTGIITLLVFSALMMTGILSIYRFGVGGIIMLYIVSSFLIMIAGKWFSLMRARNLLLALADNLELRLSGTEDKITILRKKIIHHRLYAALNWATVSLRSGSAN